MVPSYTYNEKSIKSPASSYDFFFNKNKGRAKHICTLPLGPVFRAFFPFPYSKSVYEEILSQMFLNGIQVCEL